jgi:hypothetical protein
LFDDFNDNLINTQLWNSIGGGSGPTVSETNQRLEFTIPASSFENPVGQIFFAAYSSNCLLRGDYDIQVDYQLLTWPFANGVRLGLNTALALTERTSLGPPTDFPGQPREVYVQDVIGGGLTFLGTGDLSGKLRQVRTGNTLTSYRFSGGVFLPFATALVSTADTLIQLAAWSEDRLFTDRTVQAAFDNFAVNSGQVICPQNPPVLAPIANQTVAEGSTLTLTATATDPDGNALTFSLDTAPSGASIHPTTGVFTWTPLDGPASATVTVRVTDNGTPNLSDTKTFTISVTNVAPTATPSNSGPVNEGSTATVSFSGQFDPSPVDTAAGFRYAYDFDNNGTFEVGNGTYAGSSTSASATVPASFLLDGPGSRTVRGRILDKDGGFTDYTTTITINNVPPANVTLNGPFTIDENGTVTLTGSFTDPGTLDTHTVVINWGPGEGSTTLNLAANVLTFSASHQYLDDNPSGTSFDVYPISVTVTDKDGASATAGTTATVRNVAPVVAINGPFTINENGSVTLTGTITDPGTLDPHTVVITWGSGEGSTTLNLAAGVLTFSATHQYLDDNPSGTPSDVYPISVTVTDDDTGSGSGNTSVTVNNVAPSNVSLTLSATAINENGSVTLSGSFIDPGTLDTHTVVINWGPGEMPTTLSLPLGARTFSAMHQYLDDNPTNTPSDLYPISVTVTDDDTGSGSGSTAVTVNNVPPVITGLTNSAVECGNAAEGDPVTLSATFTDVGTLDTHTATINWGDGMTTSGTVVESGGSGTVSGSHAYVTGGIYTITLTVRDDDTGTATQTTVAIITGAGVHGDQLQIIGTRLDDHVTVNKQGTGLFKVHTDFFPEAAFRTFSTAGINKIVIVLCDGDDHATVSGEIETTVLMDGGEGNDDLNGGGGANVVVGGDGDDMLVGGSNRDILIGGRGADRLVGNGGEDLLIAGYTAFDGDYAALCAILAEWNSSRSYATRVANLQGTGSGSTFASRLNGNYFLTASGSGRTVFDDGDADVLTGSAGRDWFFANLAGGVLDTITDLQPDEFALDINP